MNIEFKCVEDLRMGDELLVCPAVRYGHIFPVLAKVQKIEFMPDKTKLLVCFLLKPNDKMLDNQIFNNTDKVIIAT